MIHANTAKRELELPKDKDQSLKLKHDKALSELESYKLLVESVEDYAIFLLDPDGRVRSWNKGAEKLKGYTKLEIVGKHFSCFYTQSDKDDHKPERELEIARKNGKVEDEDWRVRKDGSRFWANVVITALFDAERKLVGYAKVTRDLSERKHHEDELRHANTLLRRQQQELTELNDAKDEFISLASHQLRTPATAVKQLIGLLLEGFQGDIEDKHRLTLEKAYKSNDRQIAIVNSLLKVAQLDSGRVDLKKESFDLLELARVVVSEQMEAVETKGQTLSLICGDHPVMIMADQKYLRMALENVIDNASKYTENGGSITVRVKDGAKLVEIHITDTGIGIPEDQLPLLFQKFKRIPSELMLTTEGTGLGLYWLRKVVVLHGGRVDVNSRPSKGTTFVITLPKEDHA